MLTRLALSYCLGKGSLTRSSRSWSLQISHPRHEGDYADYQWTRLSRILPSIQPPKFHLLNDDRCTPGAGQWRLRVSSRYFQSARNLLYPEGHFSVNPDVTALIGAEGMASLWADRGRVFISAKKQIAFGRLNLSRFDHEGATTIANWIRTLTGASGSLHLRQRSQRQALELCFEHDDIIALMHSLRTTWMSQAECLSHRFRTPIKRNPNRDLLITRPSADPQLPAEFDRTPPVPLLRIRHASEQVGEELLQAAGD